MEGVGGRRGRRECGKNKRTRLTWWKPPPFSFSLLPNTSTTTSTLLPFPGLIVLLISTPGSPRHLFVLPSKLPTCSLRTEEEGSGIQGWPVFSFNGSWFLLSEQPVSLPPPSSPTTSLMTCQRTPTAKRPPLTGLPTRQGCPSLRLKSLTAIWKYGSVVTGKGSGLRGGARLPSQELVKDGGEAQFLFIYFPLCAAE